MRETWGGQELGVKILESATDMAHLCVLSAFLTTRIPSFSNEVESLGNWLFGQLFQKNELSDTFMPFEIEGRPKSFAENKKRELYILTQKGGLTEYGSRLFKYDESNPTSTRITVFINETTCGELSMTTEDAVRIADIVKSGCSQYQCDFESSGELHKSESFVVWHKRSGKDRRL